MVVGTSIPPTQTTTIVIVLAQSNEEDEANNLISSLRKLLEKRKLVNSLEKTLTTILDKMQKVVITIDTPIDIQQRTTILCKAFDDEFSTLINVATIQAQIENDNKLLNTMCTNMRNDIETLKICFKELRQCLEEGK